MNKADLDKTEYLLYSLNLNEYKNKNLAYINYYANSLNDSLLIYLDNNHVHISQCSATSGNYYLNNVINSSFMNFYSSNNGCGAGGHGTGFGPEGYWIHGLRITLIFNYSN